MADKRRTIELADKRTVGRTNYRVGRQENRRTVGRADYSVGRQEDCRTDEL